MSNDKGSSRLTLHISENYEENIAHDILSKEYWKYEETQGEESKWYEIPIILPELYLKKSNRNVSGIEYEHFTQRSR